MANHEWSVEQLRAKAEAYCAMAEHCTLDVRQKLQQWDATSEQIEDIVAHLQEARFIDEKRYCHAFVHDKLTYQGWGRRKIQAQLQTKHLPSATIAEALDAINEDEYMQVLERVVAAKKRSIKSTDPQANEKLLRFCLQRGFTYEEIRSCL